MRDSVPSARYSSFVMYCVNGKPRSSLFIESTDSMIIIISIVFWVYIINIRNESTEVQTLGAIRIQLYHQCFEQVWQHNFTSIIGLRRSTQRHRSSKVGTSIVDLRKSTQQSSKVDTSIIDLRRSTHRSSKIEGGNIASTTQHRADIPTIRHRILSTTALHNYYT